jgi:predicted amidohydrolase
LERIRVASLQYFIRPVSTFEQFQEQVAALVETAADYKCHLIVFPEYFTIQLLTLGNVKRPIKAQVRDLAKQVPRFIELMKGLAIEHKIYIAAGTIPVQDEVNVDVVHNDCYFFAPSGKYGVQGKLHATRFETEDWLVSSRSKLKIFDTDFGKVAITICYDVEFPEIARAAAKNGAQILIVPSSLLRTCSSHRKSNVRDPIFHGGLLTHGPGRLVELRTSGYLNSE